MKKLIDSNKMTVKEICFFSIIVLWLVGVLYTTIHSWILIIEDINNLIIK